jgi:hypothetical protein
MKYIMIIIPCKRNDASPDDRNKWDIFYTKSITLLHSNKEIQEMNPYVFVTPLDRGILQISHVVCFSEEYGIALKMMVFDEIPCFFNPCGVMIKSPK